MKKLSIIFGIAMLMLGMFVSTSGTSSAARLQGPATDPVPCSNCTPQGQFNLSVREASSQTGFVPIAGANVSVFSNNGTGMVASGTTDAKGNFSVGLQAGDYSIRVTASGFTSDTYDASVATGKTTNVTAVLDHNYPLPCLGCVTPR